MLGKAVAKHIRMTPRKVRYVINPIRKRTVAEAFAILGTTNRRAAKPVTKALKAALASARNKEPMISERDLVISKVCADPGATWKRFRAAAFGRAVPVLKRTSHITLELDRK